jgi:hypothetical protein
MHLRYGWNDWCLCTNLVYMYTESVKWSWNWTYNQDFKEGRDRCSRCMFYFTSPKHLLMFSSLTKDGTRTLIWYGQVLERSTSPRVLKLPRSSLSFNTLITSTMAFSCSRLPFQSPDTHVLTALKQACKGLKNLGGMDLIEAWLDGDSLYRRMMEDYMST